MYRVNLTSLPILILNEQDLHIVVVFFVFRVCLSQSLCVFVCLSVCLCVSVVFCLISSFIVIKRTTLFECQCISHERSNWRLYCFYFSYWRRDRHFTKSSEPHVGLAVCKAKTVPSFLGVFVLSRESNPWPSAQVLFRLSFSCCGNLS